MAAFDRAAPPIVHIDVYIPHTICHPRLSPFVPRIAREWERAPQQSYNPRLKGRTIFKRYPLRPQGYGYKYGPGLKLGIHPLLQRPAWHAPAVWKSTARLLSEPGNNGIKRRCIEQQRLYIRFDELPEPMDIDVQWENMMDLDNSAPEPLNIFPSPITIGARFKTNKRSFDNANDLDNLTPSQEDPTQIARGLEQPQDIPIELEIVKQSRGSLYEDLVIFVQAPETSKQASGPVEECLEDCEQLWTISDEGVAPRETALVPYADAENVESRASAIQHTSELVGRSEEESITYNQSFVTCEDLAPIEHREDILPLKLADYEALTFGHSEDSFDEKLRDFDDLASIERSEDILRQEWTDSENLSEPQESLPNTVANPAYCPVQGQFSPIYDHNPAYSQTQAPCAHVEDDKDMLLNFLVRANAKKAAKAAEYGAMPKTVPEAGGATPPRKALGELDRNSPSPQKNDASALALSEGDLIAGKSDRGSEDLSKDTPHPLRKRRSALSPNRRPGTPTRKTRLYRKPDPNNPFLSFQPRMNLQVLRSLGPEELTALAAANTQRNAGVIMKAKDIKIELGPWEKTGNKAKTVSFAEQLTHVRIYKQSWGIHETVYEKGLEKDRLKYPLTLKMGKSSSEKASSEKSSSEKTTSEKMSSEKKGATKQEVASNKRSAPKEAPGKRFSVLDVDPRLMAESLNSPMKTEGVPDVNSGNPKGDLKPSNGPDSATRPEEKGSSVMQTKLKAPKQPVKFESTSDFATRSKRQVKGKADEQEQEQSPVKKFNVVSMSEVSSRVTRNSARQPEAKEVPVTKIPKSSEAKEAPAIKIPKSSAAVSRIPSRRGGAAKPPLGLSASDGNNAVQGRKLRRDRT